MRYVGKTREEIIDLLGIPDQFAGASRKTPSRYAYGDIQYYFHPWKNGTCYMVFDNRKDKVLESIPLMEDIK